MQTKKYFNLLLILLVGYSMYLTWQVPQPYGKIALLILAITALFNFIKNRKISIPFYLSGIAGSFFVLIAAYHFTSYTKEQRDRFNIPTAVKFEQSNFENALAKAKNENKPIFIDFYTGWCVPCLKFTETVLTDKEVGQHMNSAFINLKYDAEKGEGVSLSKRYKVSAYPTLLVIDKDGKILEDVMQNQLPAKEDMIKLSTKYKLGLK